MADSHIKLRHWMQAAGDFEWLQFSVWHSESIGLWISWRRFVLSWCGRYWWMFQIMHWQMDVHCQSRSLVGSLTPWRFSAGSWLLQWLLLHWLFVRLEIGSHSLQSAILFSCKVKCSTPSFYHGPRGTSCGSIVSFHWLVALSWHVLHDWSVALISWVIPGQWTQFLTERFIFSAPKSPMWSVLHAEFLIKCGTMSVSFLHKMLFSPASSSCIQHQCHTHWSSKVATLDVISLLQLTSSTLIPVTCSQLVPWLVFQLCSGGDVPFQ